VRRVVEALQREGSIARGYLGVSTVPARLPEAIAQKLGQPSALLVAGVDPSVTKPDLARRIPGSGPWLACCIDLGSESVDTRSNAEESGRWLRKSGFRSFRLITSDWHMRRARYEFMRVLGTRYQIVPDAVRTEPSFFTLFGEYNKYLLRRVAVWVDL